MFRYIVRGSSEIASSQGHATLAEARLAIEAQRADLVAVAWPDGSVAYYVDAEDAILDQLGELAVAVATREGW